MEHTKEIAALLNLIDDPDEEVFGAVSQKIIEYGRNIIPDLENLWETIVNEEAQERIELLIHRLHFTDLTNDVHDWCVSGHHDLTVGALLASKFQYPDLSTTGTLVEIEKLRRNIWLELNNYITPLEQVRIVSGILYGYYGLKGTETAYSIVNEFLIHKLLETKRGNQINNGVLYLLLCDLLDLPVKAIGVPKQFVLAYFKPGYSSNVNNQYRDMIEFYIDPTTGQVFTQKDIVNYFDRLAEAPDNEYFKPLTNKRILQYLFTEMAKCFDTDKERYKMEELHKLATSLD
ncbi:MAG: transglutaminase family protein [Chitinophagaceae bacterium]